MASTTPDTALDDALLAVELELMRTPSLARLNGARRREIARGILETLHARGVIAGITSLEDQPLLRAA
jgi:hypothetical protein